MNGATLGPPHSTGLDPHQEAVKQRELEQARRQGWPQLELADLVDRRFGMVEHKPTGRLYRRHRGELVDLVYSSATAFYVTPHGGLAFLESPPGFPATVTELEQRRAEREQRRSAQATKTHRGGAAMKFYTARFAPLATTRREAIRNAQVVCDHGTSFREVFSESAFRGWGRREIRVLLDHDPRQRAGTVTAISPYRDWWIGSFVLDGPCAARAEDWIERSGKLSPGFDPGEMDPDFARPITPAHYATHWHTRALLREISILPPGAIAWYAGAKVLHSYESKAAPAPSRSPAKAHARQDLIVRETGRRYVDGDLVIDRSDGTQEIHCLSRRTITRYGIGKIIAIR